MLTKKTQSRTGFVVGLVCVVIALLLVFGKYTFRMSEADIQSKLSEVLPITNSGVVVQAIEVELAESQGTVFLQVSGEAIQLRRTFAFTLQAEGVPEYQFLKGQFFFRPDAVEVIRLEQVAGESVEETTSRIRDFALELFPERTEIIDEFATAAINVAPEIQRWLEGKAEGVAVYVLQRAPIYTLPNDAKGLAAQAVLDSVAIENKELVVVLSVYRLGVWVLIFGLSGVIALGYALALGNSSGRR